MSTYLVEVIEARIVRVVLATSTLSEGVNLPFETVLIPSVTRYRNQSQESITVREFSNLAGRAGRPGFGTEGQSLVLLKDPASDRSSRQSLDFYRRLTASLATQSSDAPGSQSPESPLAHLLTQLVHQWRRITGSADRDQFYDWLEQTVPQRDNALRRDDLAAHQALDSVDGVLLAAIVEAEQLSDEELSLDEIEHRLQQIWRHTYAYYAATQESTLSSIFVRRGRALRSTIYPDRNQRRRLYHTSLPPGLGRHMLAAFPTIRAGFEAGSDYALWDSEAKFEYIKDILSSLVQLPHFHVGDKRAKAK